MTSRAPKSVAPAPDLPPGFEHIWSGDFLDGKLVVVVQKFTRELRFTLTNHDPDGFRIFGTLEVAPVVSLEEILAEISNQYTQAMLEHRDEVGYSIH